MPSITFNYTGGWKTFTVPTGVKSVNIAIRGAGSGASKGGRVAGNAVVTPGTKLYVLAGEAGNANNVGTGGPASIGGGGAGGKGVSHNGGDGGGGYSIVRYGSTAGKIVAVAGGAGGKSGDYGLGGDGGATIGESGSRGGGASGATGVATGGTVTQGGSGGTSSSGSRYYGGDASDTVLSRAGAGGSTGGYSGNGGGGGGGGWHPGGGGAGGSFGNTPAGGGGGGSSAIGVLTSASNVRGYATGNGQIIITWTSPAPAVQPPNTPSLVAPERGKRTSSNGSVTVTANLSDPAKRSVRLYVTLYVDNKGYAVAAESSAYVQQKSTDSSKSASVTFTGLKPNTHYYARLYARNDKLYSKSYSGTDFYTNYSPNPPPLYTPHNGLQVTGLDALVFTWGYSDPDGGSQSLAQFRYRRDVSGAAWSTHTISGNNRTYTIDGATLTSNQFYLWQVRTRDAGGLYSEWSDTYRFFVSGVSIPPRLVSPYNDQAVDSGNKVTFKWKFVDPDPGDSQVKADIRYRVVGTSDWIFQYGTSAVTGNGVPGGNAYWIFPARTFQSGFHYEWEARTYDQRSGGLTPSDWSSSESFYTVATPGALSTNVPILGSGYRSVLGTGHHRVMVMTKGGRNFLGELSNPTYVQWGRVRDDISKAVVRLDISTNSNLKQLIRNLRTWQNELKIYRDTDGEPIQVWEGPITRIEMIGDKIEVEAQDPMVWVYRRIMRQGYSDAYPGIRTVVDRAARIIINALAPDDPNILTYLTQFSYPDDAKQSRVRADYSSTAWEEVDDLAAKAGLDYTVVGRRIILNDTHRPIGRLPTLTNKDFMNELVVTEYGMNLATTYAVTNGSGIYGRATRSTAEYGKVELLSSAYGDQATGADETLTAAAKAKLVGAFESQAARNIAHRYPAPIQVRVPDSTGMNPNSPVSIDHLIPGVWIPLMAGGIRPVRQVQKLDKVDVTETDGAETVAVTMQPAPNGGEDPDNDAAIEADS